MKNSKMLMLVSTIFLLFPVESFSAEKAHFNEDVINIKEDGEIFVRADKATVAMVIKYENESFENSIKECIKYREEIKNALYKAGFNDKEVKISNYSSIPVVGAFSGKLKKYKIENRIEINFSDEKKLTVLASIIDKYPYLEFRSILFSVNNKDSIKTELRKNIDDKIEKRKLEIENKYPAVFEFMSLFRKTINYILCS